MQKLRLAIIGILLHLTFFFNLERIDIVGENALNIQTFVYILSFVAIFSVIVIPNLWRHNVVFGYILWLGIYLVVKFWLNPNGRVVFGDLNTYITITEIAMVAITIMLSHNLAVCLNDAEEAIKNIMMIDVSQKVRLLDEALEDIDLELYRSRRNHLPLSVIVMELVEEDESAVLNQTVEEIIRNTRKHYVSMSLARAMRKGLRRTDYLLHQMSKGRFILFSPETNQEEAQQMVGRLNRIAGQELGVFPNFGIATFPDEALTFEELLTQAEAKILQADTLKMSEEREHDVELYS